MRAAACSNLSPVTARAQTARSSGSLVRKAAAAAAAAVWLPVTASAGSGAHTYVRELVSPACDARRSVLPSKPVAPATLSSDLNMVAFLLLKKKITEKKDASRSRQFYRDDRKRSGPAAVETGEGSLSIFSCSEMWKMSAEQKFHFGIPLSSSSSSPPLAGQICITMTSGDIKGILAHFSPLVHSARPHISLTSVPLSFSQPA